MSPHQTLQPQSADSRGSACVSAPSSAGDRTAVPGTFPATPRRSAARIRARRVQERPAHGPSLQSCDTPALQHSLARIRSRPCQYPPRRPFEPRHKARDTRAPRRTDSDASPSAARLNARYQSAIALTSSRPRDEIASHADSDRSRCAGRTFRLRLHKIPSPEHGRHVDDLLHASSKLSHRHCSCASEARHAGAQPRKDATS